MKNNKLDKLTDLEDWSVSDLYDLRDRVICMGREDNTLSHYEAQEVSSYITQIMFGKQVVPKMRELAKDFIEERTQ